MSYIDIKMQKPEMQRLEEKYHSALSEKEVAMCEGNLQLMIIELQTLLQDIKRNQNTTFNNTRMLKKNEVLERLGVAPTNPIKNKIFTTLPTYDNKFSKQAIFKEEDVMALIHSFPVMNQGN